MANKKQKEAAEMLIEKNRDFDRLSLRVNEIETELERYKSRESDIAAAMTMAAQAKANIISDAERTADAMLRNAKKQADALIKEAEEKAKTTISEAEQRSAEILNDAKEKSTALTEKTQIDTQALLTAAKNSSDKLNDHCTAINTVLLKLAGELYDYILDYKDTYEELTGKKIGDVTVQKKQKAHKTPDSYETPEDLYHTVMKLEGRAKPETTEEEKALPESVPFSEELFGDDDPTENIESILNMDSVNSPKEQHIDMTNEIKADKKHKKPTDSMPDRDNENAEASNNIGLTEKQSPTNETENLKASESETEMISAILNDFMNNLLGNAEPVKTEGSETEKQEPVRAEEATPTDTEKPSEPTQEATASSTEVDSILNDIIGEGKSNPTGIAPAPDDLNAILNDIFGKKEETTTEA